jgi:hypothetical protein
VVILLKEVAQPAQIQQMLGEYDSMIKIAVDIRRNILAGGGEMHADCEQVLLENGSEQDDIWGANWYQDEGRVEFEALINIRPAQGNRGMVIQNQDIRNAVERITKSILGAL